MRSLLKKQSRLKKLNDFIDGFHSSHCDDLASVFIDPTDKEIELARSESGRCIRGVIYDNGTEYCWNGNVLHHEINKKLASSKSTLHIDVENSFRFAYDGGCWILDAHNKFTLKETCEMFLQHQNKLSRYGNINDTCEIYYLKGNVLRTFSGVDIEEVVNTIEIDDYGCLSFCDDTLNSINLLLEYMNENDLS